MSLYTVITLLTVNTLTFKEFESRCDELKPLPSCPTVGMLGPRNLRVSDEWYTRFRVSWDAAPSRVNGYKLIYQPEGMDAFLCVHFTQSAVSVQREFTDRVFLSSQALTSLWRCLSEM